MIILKTYALCKYGITCASIGSFLHMGRAAPFRAACGRSEGMRKRQPKGSGEVVVTYVSVGPLCPLNLRRWRNEPNDCV